MIKIILITIVLLSLGFLALGFNVFFRRNKKFPQSSVGKNKKMNEMGIHCAKSEEIKCRNNIENKKYCDSCLHS